ncbi:unnamed protein product, partial [Didymodactylos carnosus]
NFDELMLALSKNGSLCSLNLSIKMLDEEERLVKLNRSLTNAHNLVCLQIHGNNIQDKQFIELCSVLQKNCLKLKILDIGDNCLTNKSIGSLCPLLLTDQQSSGLEELYISSNRSITSAGWTELLFASELNITKKWEINFRALCLVSYNSYLKRLSMDYNHIDNVTLSMLAIVISSSRTLTYVDLECCNLTEYAGQLLLSLLTRYPVELNELVLEKNPLITEKTLTLINDCLELKTKNKSANRRLSTVSSSSIVQNKEHDRQMMNESVKTKNKNIRFEQSQVSKTSDSNKQEIPKKNPQTVTSPRKQTTKKELQPPALIRQRQQQIDQKEVEIQEEELLPVEIDSFGGNNLPMFYWTRM